ncbi:hypothetical protein T492DRAFT_111479 [Pavlovales sp. CCMP2436]|nr:hypothetical protein T492DRAFT_111479 [Pavlovales sp. CCMP2436]
MAAGSAGSAEAGSEAAAGAAAGAAGAVGADYSPAMLAMKAKQPRAIAAGSEAGSAEAGSTAVASTAPLCLRPRATASPSAGSPSYGRSAVSPSYGRTGGATRGSYNAGRGRRANDQQYTEAVRSALKSGATGGETAVATESTLPPSSDHARPGVDLICLRFALRASLAQESAST